MIRDRIVRVAVPPAFMPVSLVDMKEHLRVTGSAEDALITSYTAAAVASLDVDGELGRAIVTQTIAEALQRPTRDTYLSVSPAQELVSVKYYDTDNIEQTADLSDFAIYKSDDWAFVRSDNWPATYDRPDAVTISYTAGFDPAPDDICHAIKMIVGHWYEHREDANEIKLSEVPRAVGHLIGNRRGGWYG